MQVTMQNAVQVNGFCNVCIPYNIILFYFSAKMYPEADEMLEPPQVICIEKD